jgi:hypothetical protein
MNKPRISVTVTPYEGNDFPEATHYPDFVAEALAEHYPNHKIEVLEGSKNRAFIYGRSAHDTEADDIAELAQYGLWDEFCTEGYKAYSGE